MMKILVTYEHEDILSLIEKDLSSKGMSVDMESATLRTEANSAGMVTNIAVDVRVQDFKEGQEDVDLQVERRLVSTPMPAPRDFLEEAPEPGRGPVRLI